VAGKRNSKKLLAGINKVIAASSSASTASPTPGEPGYELRLRLSKAITTNGVVDANVHMELIATVIERVKGVSQMRSII